MEDNRIIRNNIEMPPNGRIEGFTMVVVDKSSKLPLCDDCWQFVDENEQMKDNERFVKDRQTMMLLWNDLARSGDHFENGGNIWIFLSWIEAIMHNMLKLIGNVRTSLHTVEKL